MRIDPAPSVVNNSSFVEENEKSDIELLAIDSIINDTQRMMRKSSAKARVPPKVIETHRELALNQGPSPRITSEPSI